MGLVSTALARSFLQLDGTCDDAMLGEMIDAASELVEIEIGCKVLVADYVRTLAGDGSNIFFPPDIPIRSITSLSLDGRSLVGTGDYADFAYNERFITLRSGLTFSRYLNNIVISYRAGYDTVPPDVKMAVLHTLKVGWLGQGEGGGAIEEVAGGMKVKYATFGGGSSGSIPASASRLLVRYRRAGFI